MSLLMISRRRGAATPGDPTYPLPTSGANNVTPTYDGTGYIIHPSVIDMGGPWGVGGFRWWRADTPYYGSNAAVENPSIWGSNDRINWTVPTGLTNPIDPWPGEATSNLGNYNSDTELRWDPVAGHLICYWREWDGTNALIWAATSTDGATWANLPAPVLTVSGTSPNKSPAIARNPNTGQWRMLMFGAPAVAYTATDPLGPWTLDPAPFTGWVGPDGKAPYHGSTIYHEPTSSWWAIFSLTNLSNYPAVSIDGAAWVVGAQVSTGYRSTMCLSTEPDMVDIWASSTSRYYRVLTSHWLDLLPTV